MTPDLGFWGRHVLMLSVQVAVVVGAAWLWGIGRRSAVQLRSMWCLGVLGLLCLAAMEVVGARQFLAGWLVPQAQSRRVQRVVVWLDPSRPAGLRPVPHPRPSRLHPPRRRLKTDC